ncbi:bifunctional lysylphosphatidylglycerol flippase/synthetase MprF [Arthrobacter sp. GCM10027362]|uniref:bifunctional lysylphosphatidylglycerol flippase/synthetase MprF n=1 Tax=Arthrobacter sp. GCM10027362 TaxID=3273379 RepID=UPI00362A1D76
MLWAAGIADSRLVPAARHQFRDAAAVSVDSFPDDWWTLFSSALWAPNLAAYLSGSVLVLAVGLAFEKRMGSLRFGVAALAGHLSGTAATLLLAVAVQGLQDSWAEALADGDYLGPTALACSVLAAGSASMSALWRRRIRTGLLALLVVLVLYTGYFGDSVRLVAAVAGLLLGPWLTGTAGRRFHAAATVRELRVLVAVVVVATAVGPVLAGLDAQALGPLSYLQYVFTGLEPRDPAEVRELCASGDDLADCLRAQAQLRSGAAAMFMAVIPSYLLLLCAAGLRRGRRAAWLGALAVYAAMSVVAGAEIVSLITKDDETTVAQGLASMDFGQTVDEVVPLVVPVVLFTALLLAGRLFNVRAPRATYRWLAAKVAAAAAVIAAAYMAAATALAGQFSPVPGPDQILADLPNRFLPLGYALGQVPAFIPSGGLSGILYDGAGTVLWLIVTVLLLRSFRHPKLPDNQLDAERARSILQASGGGNLGWMTTWPGNDYWFSPSGRSFVAYRVNSAVALTVGGPVGPEEEHDDVVDGFTAFCTHFGWTPCFYSVTEPLRRLAAGRGWGHVQVAEETVLDLDGLSFSGKKFQDVRTALNRAQREGIRAEWYSYASAPRSITEQIRAIDEEWVADKDLPEMGFTLGGLAELADPQVRVLAAVDDEDRVHGVASWLPVHHEGRVSGWTLDYMRRSGSGFRPTMEFLIASAAKLLAAEGYGFVSLSGAPLARSAGPPRSGDPGGPDVPGPPALDTFLDWLGSALEPVYGFRSLMAFKEKFQPGYQPLFLLYPDPAALPRIGNAVARAYLPDVSVRQSVVLLHKVLDKPRRRPGLPSRGDVPSRNGRS